MSHLEYSDSSMLDLFRTEAETTLAVLVNGLMELEEQKELSPQEIEPMMRAAHSLKGAARIVDLKGVAQVAHALEDCFVAIGAKNIELNANHIDALLQGTDLLKAIAEAPEKQMRTWKEKHKADLSAFLESIRDINKGKEKPI